MYSIMVKAVTTLPQNYRPIQYMAERFDIEPISAFVGMDLTSAVFMIDNETAKLYDGLEHIERITKFDMDCCDTICFDVKVRKI